MLLKHKDARGISCVTMAVYSDLNFLLLASLAFMSDDAQSIAKAAEILHACFRFSAVAHEQLFRERGFLFPTSSTLEILESQQMHSALFAPLV